MKHEFYLGRDDNRLLSLFKINIILVVIALILSSCSFNLAGDVTPPPGAEQISHARTQPAESESSVYPLVPPDAINGKTIY